MPERTYETIKGEQAVRIDSPLGHWPGHIYVPRSLSADQYGLWWEKYQAAGGDERPQVDTVAAIRRMYRERCHMIIESHIEGLESFDEDMPYLALMNFVVAAMQPLILEARFLPNLPGWWSNTATGDEETDAE